jgi:hypothetical protein
MQATAEPSGDVTSAMAGGSEALYALLAARLRQRPGFDLLTVLAPNRGGDRLVRLFSTNTGQYPLGDADPVQDDRWFRHLFVKKEPVIANDAEAIRDWLPDYSEFAAMGYGSLANLPVVVSGEAVGLMNLMAAPGHFSAANLAAFSAELPLVALAILAHAAKRPVLA